MIPCFKIIMVTGIRCRFLLLFS